MNAGLIDGGPVTGDRVREPGVQEEARRGDQGHAEHQRDHDRSGQHVERLPVQCVGLQVEHGRPDPHRGQHLDQGEPPVGEQELYPREEHHEGAHDQRERGEPAPGTAQPQDDLVRGGHVAVPDRLDEPLDLRPPGGSPRQGLFPVANRRQTLGRCSRLLGCIPLDRHYGMPSTRLASAPRQASSAYSPPHPERMRQQPDCGGIVDGMAERSRSCLDKRPKLQPGP